MSCYQLAQVNIALPVAPLTSDQLADFVAALDPVNAKADAAPGFVWRLQTEAGDVTGIRGFGDDRLIVNMSVWSSLERLADFVYRSPGHSAVMRRRREWFEKLAVAYHALWWIPSGHQPTISEAEERLGHLRSHGPTDVAFTFRTRFPPPLEPRDDEPSVGAGGVNDSPRIAGAPTSSDWFCPA
jgi:hypothetical protein